MPLLFALLLALFLGTWFGPGGFFFGALAGLIGGIAWQQSQKLARLEARVAALEAGSPAATAMPSTEAPAAPAQPEVTPVQPETAAVSPQTAAAIPEAAAAPADTTPAIEPAIARPAEPSLFDARRVWAALQPLVVGGNPVVRIGAVVLFFGIAFLLRYAYENAWLPIELRLAGATLLGIVLVLTGWRWRHRQDTFGVVLQGAGVGILYLTIFAAARLYDLLPLPAAFAILVVLVAASSVLAVLQHAQALAMFAMSGGFLAPVLMSTGAGSHVALFSYYLLLNAGILAMAWFRAWRALNWLGFAFTFVIGALWGYRYYAPELFWSTEPFLVAFFLFYVAVSVLFARREGVRLRGLVDGTLVFGVPLAASALQWGLVRDLPFGMAGSALTASALYLGLAAWLKRAGLTTALLGQAFLALAIVFATLAVPFAFDNQRLTGATWALEGVGLLWVGIRQRQLLPRLAGVALQFAAAVAWFASPARPDAAILVNAGSLGAALIGLAGLASAWLIARNDPALRRFERPIGYVLLAWGTLWWFTNGLTEIARYAPAGLEYTADVLDAHLMLLFCAASVVTLCMAARRLHWAAGQLPGYLLLPFAALVMFWLVVVVDRWRSITPLAELGFLAWPAVFAAAGLHLAQPGRGRTLLPAWHAGWWWLIAAFGAWLVAALVYRVLPSGAWTLAPWGAVPLVCALMLRRVGPRQHWPFTAAPAAYFGWGNRAMLGALVLWVVVTLWSPGDPAPLPYVPLVNPLELTQAGILLAAWLALRGSAGTGADTLRGVLGLAAFAWLNFATARAVHYFADVAYPVDAIFYSDPFQTTASILWTVVALLLMGGGTRRGQRITWMVGAALLALVLLKLFTVDISRLDVLARIVSFVAVGLLMLVIGFFAPLPPARRTATDPAAQPEART